MRTGRVVVQEPARELHGAGGAGVDAERARIAVVVRADGHPDRCRGRAVAIHEPSAASAGQDLRDERLSVGTVARGAVVQPNRLGLGVGQCCIVRCRQRRGVGGTGGSGGGRRRRLRAGLDGGRDDRKQGPEWWKPTHCPVCTCIGRTVEEKTVGERDSNSFWRRFGLQLQSAPH